MRILALFLFLQVSIFGADVHVRQGAGGSANGTDWDNAYTSIITAYAASSRGDTIYVADGAYTTPTINKAVSGTTQITIKKATIAEHGTSTGWVDTYGDGVAAMTGQLWFQTGYHTISGVSGGGPANTESPWITGYGFTITYTASFPIIYTTAPTGSNVVTHVQTIGAGNNGNGGDWGNDSVSSGGAGAIYVEHSYLSSAGRCHIYHGDGPQYHSWNYFGEYESVGLEHAEMAVVRSSDLLTIRYSIIVHEEGTGLIISANDSQGRDGPNGHATVDFYGNVIYQSNKYGAWDTAINGILASFTLDAFQRNWKVYNNSFINVTPDAYGESGESPLGNVSKNNYFYLSSSHTPDTGWTQSYEHFQNSGSASGSNSSTGTGDPFVAYTTYNFNLVADSPAGNPNVAPYDLDMFGNRYDANGGWTKGAIAFSDLFSGMVSHWHFEEAATGPWIDSYGANDLTLSSGTAFSNTGKINNAIDLDASSVAIVQVADNASFGFTTAFSVSVWVFPETITANMGILGKWNYNTDGGWVLQTDGVTGDGFMAFIARTAADGGNTWLRWNSWGTMSANNWYHAVLVYDGSQTGDDNRLKLYVNGTLTLSTAQGSPEVPASLVADTAPLRVGMFGTGLPRHFNGRIDEVRLWNRVLTSDEVTELYNLENGADITAPTLSSAIIPSGGTTISLAFDETVSVGAGGNSGWTISMTGGAATLTYSSGSGTSTLVYSISRTINAGETGTVAYTQPGNGIEDSAGNDLATIGTSTVTNNSSQSGGAGGTSVPSKIKTGGRRR